MAETSDLLLGEWNRTVDERFRLTLPAELADRLAAGGGSCAIAKERPGCVSLWSLSQWESWLAAGVDLLESKIQGGRLRERVESVQELGRLLSTRHRTIPIAGRGRIAIPETFREFLGVEPGGDALVVGAAVCIEIWHPLHWGEHIREQMPSFRRLFDELTQ